MLIGVLNLIILISLIKLFAKLRREHVEEAEVDELLESRGFISRFVGPYFKLITVGMYYHLVSYLDLDLTPQVKLHYSLFLQAHHNKQFHFIGILSLPILFASGMSLLDTLDGVVMKYAYNWAFFNPIRKIYYNITITAISVMAALVIGMIELLNSC